jgi:hypothetical protein
MCGVSYRVCMTIRCIFITRTHISQYSVHNVNKKTHFIRVHLTIHIHACRSTQMASLNKTSPCCDTWRNWRPRPYTTSHCMRKV